MQFLYCATIAFSELYIGQLYRLSIPKRKKQITKSKYLERC